MRTVQPTPDRAPAPHGAPTALAADTDPGEIGLRSLLLDVDWCDARCDLDRLALSALELASRYPDQAADMARAVRAALLVRRAELRAAEAAHTSGLIAWITRTPEAVAA